MRGWGPVRFGGEALALGAHRPWGRGGGPGQRSPSWAWLGGSRDQVGPFIPPAAFMYSQALARSLGHSRGTAGLGNWPCAGATPASSPGACFWSWASGLLRLPSGLCLTDE